MYVIADTATNGVAGFGAAKGNLTAVLYSRSGGKEFHSWNALGEETQTIRCVDGKCETEKFTYDAGRRIVQLTYPDGEVVTHNYDGHGNLEALQGAANYLNTMQWNARGQVVQAAYGNGVAASYGYDAARGWLTAAEVRGPNPSANTLLYRASYTYRADAQTKTVRSTTNARMNMSFVYDNLTRLTTITPKNYAGAGGLAHPDTTTQTYAYDAIGNVTQNSAYFGATPYTYDDKGHLLTAIGGLRFNYSAGAITTIWGSVAGCALVEPRVFFWDAEQRLVRATQAGATVNFEYDASGQRIRKASQSSVTRFFGSHAEREEKSGQETRTQYYYAGSQLVAKKTQAIDASGVSTGAADTVWFHSDHLTSTRLLTDATGAKAAHYDYAIFGEETHESGAKAAANQKGFTSHEHDDELGLIYMKARYYDPVLGRFISPDSIIPEPGDPQSWNRYAYVLNNPFNNTDPTGHKFEIHNDLKEQYADARAYHAKNGTDQIFKDLEASETVFQINPVETGDRAWGKVIQWNPDTGLDVSKNMEGGPTAGSYTPGEDGGTVQSPAMNLLHEAGHLWIDMVDPNRDTDLDTDEQRIIDKIETPAAKKAGEPTRGSHGGRVVQTDCVTCTTQSKDQSKAERARRLEKENSE